MKDLFSKYGIPNTVVKYNGGHYKSDSFKQFSEQYGFYYITTSRHFPRTNGKAESAVKIAKRILKQSDVFITLLAY